MSVRAPRTSHRQASLHTRRVRDYLPPRLTVAVALVDTVRRTRLRDLRSEQVDDDDISTTADDGLRRRSARTVVAALGVAVAIPLCGVTLLGALALAGTECLPLLGRLAQYGWSVVMPLSTILLGWAGATLVADSVSVVLGRKPLR